MAEITTLPNGLPSGNDLDNIPDDLLGGPPPPADIVLAGKTLTTLASPPDPGETRRADGPRTGLRHRQDPTATTAKVSPRTTARPKLVTCWLPSDAEAEAEAAENQPPLYDDETGEPHDPDAPQESSGLDEFDPAFSSSARRTARPQPGLLVPT